MTEPLLLRPFRTEFRLPLSLTTFPLRAVRSFRRFAPAATASSWPATCAVTALVATLGMTTTVTPLLAAQAATSSAAAATMATTGNAPSSDTAPTGTAASDHISFSLRQANLGAGYAWGRGVLHFKGADYAIRVNGGGGPAIGYSNACVEGTVSNLASADDLDSTFWAVNTEATAGSGRGMMTLQNGRGAELHLTSRTKGVRLSAEAARLRFHLLGPSPEPYDKGRCS